MLERLYSKLLRPVLFVCGLCMVLSFAPSVAASPFGQGVFGADVPFGSVTSMTINLGTDVNLTLSPSGSTFVGSGSHTITVTSTDVVGYSLYVYGASGTSMTNGSETIAASANVAAGALVTNTWGYNTDGTTNYVGLNSVPTLLKTAIGPYKNGDNTTVTYGVLTDLTKGSGTYTATVTYTAVALTD